MKKRGNTKAVGRPPVSLGVEDLAVLDQLRHRLKGSGLKSLSRRQVLEALLEAARRIGLEPEEFERLRKPSGQKEV